jgi:hypothetical protein
MGAQRNGDTRPRANFADQVRWLNASHFRFNQLEFEEEMGCLDAHAVDLQGTGAIAGSNQR